MASVDDLIAALRESQRMGFLGDRPVEQVIDHSRSFCGALGVGSDGGDRLIDLGAGGGVPGLVIAFDRPDLDITLLDRRTKRTDFLERVVRRLDWHDRVRVEASDAAGFSETHAQTYDLAVARGFGPAEATLRIAARLVRPGGRVVISEPPHGDRWDSAFLDDVGVRRLDHDGPVVVFSPL